MLALLHESLRREQQLHPSAIELLQLFDVDLDVAPRGQRIEQPLVERSHRRNVRTAAQHDAHRPFTRIAKLDLYAFTHLPR